MLMMLWIWWISVSSDLKCCVLVTLRQIVLSITALSSHQAHFNLLPLVYFQNAYLGWLKPHSLLLLSQPWFVVCWDILQLYSLSHFLITRVHPITFFQPNFGQYNLNNFPHPQKIFLLTHEAYSFSFDWYFMNRSFALAESRMTLIPGRAI